MQQPDIPAICSLDLEKPHRHDLLTDAHNESTSACREIGQSCDGATTSPSELMKEIHCWFGEQYPLSPTGHFACVAPKTCLSVPKSPNRWLSSVCGRPPCARSLF